MRPLCEALRASPAEVVSLWDEAIDREPWLLPRQHASADFIPDIVAAIAEAIICEPPRRESVRRLAETAARHAGRRAASGADHARVVLEYYLLRNALWAFFLRRGGNAEQVRAILHVDVAVSLATRAALLGYYRTDLEARGEWDGALDRLVDEAPPMWEAEWDD